MATPAEKLAESLEQLKELQDRGMVAIPATSLSRTYRERLLGRGFIKEVFKGWFIISSPEESLGDSTSWYSSYWLFCQQYLDYIYKENWCLSPEQSLLLYAGNWTVPNQLVVRSPEANNNKSDLLFNTSLFSLRLQLSNDITKLDGMRVYTLPAALINCSANTFQQNPTDARTALSMVRDSSDILKLLLDGGKSVVAGRLAGAFRNVNLPRIADDILKTMQSADYDVRESDPFLTPSPVLLSNRERSPYGNRIRLIWNEWRTKVINCFPAAPGLKADKELYLKSIEDIYVTDAYHSLSIEKYKVTPEMIEKVKSGKWNFIANEDDRKHRDAMAAKGYLDAFQIVKGSIKKILDGQNAGNIADREHSDWFRGLFSPSVTAGLLKPSDLAGYRNHQVYIGQSKHVPLNADAVRDAMPVFFELLEQETEASVRAVLGHFIFVFIHPYMDGNGRMARFLMNVMLASGGYPWTVIPVEQRAVYMNALEQASVNQNIEQFAQFIAWLVTESLNNTPVAKI